MSYTALGAGAAAHIFRHIDVYALPGRFKHIMAFTATGAELVSFVCTMIFFRCCNAPVSLSAWADGTRLSASCCPQTVLRRC